jgi:hypothetical protein
MLLPTFSSEIREQTTNRMTSKLGYFFPPKVFDIILIWKRNTEEDFFRGFP